MSLQLTAFFFKFSQIFVVASPVLPSIHPLTSHDCWHIIYRSLHTPLTMMSRHWVKMI